jgi:hypothetical protein
MKRTSRSSAIAFTSSGVWGEFLSGTGRSFDALRTDGAQYPTVRAVRGDVLVEP